jgi:hypothetical protein
MNQTTDGEKKSPGRICSIYEIIFDKPNIYRHIAFVAFLRYEFAFERDGLLQYFQSV